MEEKKEYIETIRAIVESLVDYVDPIFVKGNLYIFDEKDTTTISAPNDINNLIIKNNIYPDWLIKIKNKPINEDNILIIKEFDKISEEEQKLYLDIICRGYISGEKLPKNLKIVITSEKECNLIQDIKEIVQYFEV